SLSLGRRLGYSVLPPRGAGRVFPASCADLARALARRDLASHQAIGPAISELSPTGAALLGRSQDADWPRRVTASPPPPRQASDLPLGSARRGTLTPEAGRPGTPGPLVRSTTRILPSPPGFALGQASRQHRLRDGALGQRAGAGDVVG